MNNENWQEWFEAAWREREESIYGSLFGELGPGIYPLDFEMFSSIFNCTEVDPRWLHIGVFESPPNDSRSNWLYVSSGLSNAWEADHPDPHSWSGLGAELLMQCTVQSPWALSLVRKLAAYQLLLSIGKFGGKTLDYWDRIRQGSAINGATSNLDAVFFAPSSGFPSAQQLLSGKFEFLQVIGVTSAELDFGQTNGYETLYEKLIAAGVVPIIDVERASLI